MEWKSSYNKFGNTVSEWYNDPPVLNTIAGSVVICADGGSNRLYDDMAPVRNRYNDEELSDVINNISVIFLMWSVETWTLLDQKLSSFTRIRLMQSIMWLTVVIDTQGSDIVKIDDQDSTDLTKSINHILQLHGAQAIKVGTDQHLIIVYACWSGWCHIGNQCYQLGPFWSNHGCPT